jgi:dienelactone hydrolase
MHVFILLLVAFISLANLVMATETAFVQVDSKRGVTQPFLFTATASPKAGVILFVGGNGSLKLSKGKQIGENEGNFFSRTYKTFASHGLMVALVDTPSDMDKASAFFRIGKKHATDIVAVIKYMKQKANVPIWLVGTSMGSFSATSVGIKKQKLVSGIILTSSVTKPGGEKNLAKFSAKYPNGVAGLNLSKIKKPALIVGHKNDTCKVSPPEDAAKLRKKLSNSSRVKVILLTGGKQRKSDVCAGLSEHGFYGIENMAVKTIAKFILQ